jgi:hypothetical protein
MPSFLRLLRSKIKKAIALFLTLLLAFGSAIPIPALSPLAQAADSTVTLNFDASVMTEYKNALFVNGTFYKF